MHMRRDRVYQLCDNDGCIEHFVSSFLSDIIYQKKKIQKYFSR